MDTYIRVITHYPIPKTKKVKLNVCVKLLLNIP